MAIKNDDGSVTTCLTATVGEETTQITLDCNLFESHNLISEVTESPIEDGASVVDHIITKPLTVSIEAIFSGHEHEDPGVLSAQDKFNVLNSMRLEGSLVELSTPFDLYENMVVTSLRVTNTPEVSVVNGTIRFSLTLKQVKIVNSLQVAAVEVKYKKRKRVGKKPRNARLQPTPEESAARADIILKRNLDIIDQAERNEVARKNKIITGKLKPGEVIGGQDPSNFLP